MLRELVEEGGPGEQSWVWVAGAVLRDPCPQAPVDPPAPFTPPRRSLHCCLRLRHGVCVGGAQTHFLSSSEATSLRSDCMASGVSPWGEGEVFLCRKDTDGRVLARGGEGGVWQRLSVRSVTSCPLGAPRGHPPFCEPGSRGRVMAEGVWAEGCARPPGLPPHLRYPVSPPGRMRPG